MRGPSEWLGWFIAPITDVKTGKNRSMRLQKNEALLGHAFPAHRRQQERIPTEESDPSFLFRAEHVQIDPERQLKVAFPRRNTFPFAPARRKARMKA